MGNDDILEFLLCLFSRVLVESFMIEFFLDLVFDAMNIFKHLFDIMDCEFDGFIVI